MFVVLIGVISYQNSSRASTRSSLSSQEERICFARIYKPVGISLEKVATVNHSPHYPESTWPQSPSFSIFLGPTGALERFETPLGHSLPRSDPCIAAFYSSDSRQRLGSDNARKSGGSDCEDRPRG